MVSCIQELFQFRNAGHEYWFYMSMGILILCLVAALYFRRVGHLWYPVINHSYTSVRAFVTVVIQEKQSVAYSVDCIWFNALMAAIYIVLYFVGKHYFFQKHNTDKQM